MKDLTARQIADNWIVWLKALASGEYRKTTTTLHRTEDGEKRHCCLGVAQICLKINAEPRDAYELIRLALGLHSTHGDTTHYGTPSIVALNDRNHHNDKDFANMHRDLLENVEKFTTPEAAAIVREKLAAQ